MDDLPRRRTWVVKVIRLSPFQVVLGPAEDSEPIEKKDELAAVETQNQGAEDSVTSGFNHGRLAEVIDLIQESQKRKILGNSKKQNTAYSRYKLTIDLEENLNKVGSQLKKVG